MECNNQLEWGWSILLFDGELTLWLIMKGEGYEWAHLKWGGFLASSSSIWENYLSITVKNSKKLKSLKSANSKKSYWLSNDHLKNWQI